MKISLILCATMFLLLACTPPKIKTDPAIVLIYDFTQLEFIESAYRPIQLQDYTLGRFYIESNIKIPQLAQAEATLMFKDLDTNTFLEEKYPLYAPFDLNGEKSKLLATIDTSVSVEDKRKPNMLFVVKLKFNNMIFYSNVKCPFFQPIDEACKDTLEHPETPECLKQVTSNDTLAMVYQLLKNTPLAGKETTVYRVGKIQILFASGRFKTSADGRSIDSNINESIQCLEENGWITSEQPVFLFLGTASTLNLPKAVEDEQPHFDKETVFLWEKEKLTITEYSRMDLNYKNDELPILRTLETKTTVQTLLKASHPDLNLDYLPIYSKPQGEDKPENRRIDMFVVTMEKEK